jgi:ligand-binding SRPBCC domain-containing protein
MDVTKMAIHTLQHHQVIRATPVECWAFFSNPRNLKVITPPALDFRILSVLSEKMHPGMMIEYRVRPMFGIPVTWLTEITQVCEPYYFVDEQRVGPYRIWHHEHTFRQVDDEHTEIGDKVHYVLPFGPLGEVAHPLLVKRQLRRIFDYREKAVTNFFGLRRPVPQVT